MASYEDSPSNFWRSNTTPIQDELTGQKYWNATKRFFKEIQDESSLEVDKWVPSSKESEVLFTWVEWKIEVPSKSKLV